MARSGADGTRDFFSQPGSYSHDDGFDFYSDDAARAPRTPMSNSVSRLGMEGLALNSPTQGWPNLSSYQNLLQSDLGSGSNGGRRPVHDPPPHSGTGGPIHTVGLHRPRGGGVTSMRVNVNGGGGPSSSRSRGRGGGLPPAPAALGLVTSLGSARHDDSDRHGDSDDNELEDD